MIYFYKVIDLHGQEIGCVDSHSLRYYNDKVGLMLNCLEDVAQYVVVDNTYYRIPWLHQESIKMKGKFTNAQMCIISKEEYEIYMKEQSKKENLE